jgi:hypothetical protein
MKNELLKQGLKTRQIDILDIRYYHEQNRQLENLNCSYLNTIKIRCKGELFKKILK